MHKIFSNETESKGRAVTDPIPDGYLRYTNSTVGGGIMWVIAQAGVAARGKLTYEAIWIAMARTISVVTEYSPI